ncbi:Transcription factor mbp1 [Linderina macrospora]|uniref:Transcription factor mbp1 n=1 Tax=Linderina macrospora TaxID=4868 RepID=A0ACC1JBA4_9FUNG|nr:Transcription factor mbp1 [Linderina macrospora]
MANRTNSGSSSTSASANHNDGSISSTQVWSAAYAGVEVFQQLYNGTAVMRRRKDSYVNVTQILKCAQYDKPHRTRFLEREIHTGIHEKVQGGYGKYQGTWVPLDRAISLAKQLSVYDALKHVLEYNPAPGEKPPTAPRSLESLRKRKSATLKTSAPSSATKRRASGTLRRYPSSSSLSSILNKPSDQNMHPATPSHAQPPPSHYYTPSNNTAALPPATPNSQQLPSGTPTSGAAMSWRAGPYTPAARRSGNVHNGSLANGPSHLIFMTPETPASNASSVLHQHSSMTPTGGSAAKYQGSFRVSMPDRNDLASPMMHRGPLPVTPSSAGNAYTTPTRALRDISNTYTDTTPVQGYVKGPPLNAKPSSTLDMNGSALMTPPSSTSVRRAGALGNARSMHTMSPTSMQSTATAQSGGSRPPPPPVFGHYPPNASPLGNEIGGMPRLGLPNHSASSSPGRANYHMSTAASMTSRPARSYSGSIGSISLSTPNHSRSASTVSQPQEFFGNSHSHSNSNYSSGCQALPSCEPFESGVMQGNTGLALSATAVLDFLSGLRRHQSLPNVVGMVTGT